ncbi:MAG: hypothetical protein WDM70_07050 [Nitrosomonadales bacterium]
MVSAAPGSTSGTTTYVVGLPVTLTLSVKNNGLQAATGVTVSDTVPADFSIGTLPGACSAVGQTITCTVGSVANGATSANINIPLTALNTSGGGSNTATENRSAPTGGSDTPSSPVNYTIINPYAHLTLTKSKTPALVAAGTNITNTIVVTNSTNSSSTATGTIRVTEALDANETFASYSGSGWSCSGVSVGATGTLTCDYAGASLTRGSSLASLVIITQGLSTYLGSLSNTACTGLTAGSSHLPADNSSTGNCATASDYATPRHVDLSIAKTTSIADLPASATSFYYTLTVSNANTDVATDG